MSKDINLHIKTPGADAAKKNLNDIGSAAKRAGTKAGEGGAKGARQVNKLGDAASKTKGKFTKFTSGIKGWVAGLVGISTAITGITTAIRSQISAMKEHAEIARKQQTELLNLQYLGDLFKEKPELKKEVAALAEFGVRPFGEVSLAWYAMRSAGSDLPAKMRQDILKEALELGRTEPAADITGLAQLMVIYAKQTGQRDANVIQNVLKKTVEKATSDISQLGRYFPQFLPIGITGGLTGAETAGMWAAATGFIGEPSIATPAIRNVFLALQGKGTPESQKLLAGLGVTPKMDFWQQLQQLHVAQQSGKFGTKEAETLGGKESIAMLLSMASAPETVMTAVREITSAARPDVDLTKRAITELMGQDKMARMAEDSRRLDIEIENIKGRNEKALQNKLAIQKYEKWMREHEVPEFLIRYELGKQWLGAGFTGKSQPWMMNYVRNRPWLPMASEYFKPEEFEELQNPSPRGELNLPPELINPVLNMLHGNNQPPSIHYHNDQNFYPVVGSNKNRDEDRGGEPRMPGRVY